MAVEKLIETLMALPLDTIVGLTNYNGEFQPVSSVNIETAGDSCWSDQTSYKGQRVAVIKAAGLDLA